MRYERPLNWPPQWPREQMPRYSAFTTTIAKASKGLDRELSLLGANGVTLTTNAELNRTEGISSRQRRIDDTGVAVYFTLDGEERCIPCDHWVTLEDNIHAIELTVGALRGLERWGTHQVVEAAFQGFSLLGPGQTLMRASVIPEPPKDPWWIVIGVRKDAPRAVIEREYRAWARVHHPDAGGDEAEFREITDAYREAIATR